jgi:LuxR family transcriptional activator of conjugal transfer of Ti plasmids
MHRVFQNFVDELSDADNAESLRCVMAEASAALDLSCFAYLSIPQRPGNAPVLISNYPATWTTHYIQRHYERLDPVIIQALANAEPFEWGLETETLDVSEAQRELFERAAKFGISCGFTIPIHDKCGPLAAVTFAADSRRSRFHSVINEHSWVLQLMAMYFHASARRALGCRIVDGMTLSPREVQCLEWAAQGKSAWETGRILSISRHTVAFHLDNAKTKLGVRSTIQAVARLTASKANI